MANEPAEHAEARYERRDIRLGCLLAVMLVALCVVVSLGYGIWRFYWWQADVHAEAGRSPYPMAPPLSSRLPPEPRLEQLERMQGRERANLSKRLVDQERLLHSYGPTDEKGFVHIPIDEAIKYTADRLPVRRTPQGRASHDEGLVDSGESNSGRMFRDQSP
ncbi:MAG: hypothetical protein ABFC96_16190 [Thermoguttaceae bacterium]